MLTFFLFETIYSYYIYMLVYSLIFVSLCFFGELYFFFVVLFYENAIGILYANN